MKNISIISLLFFIVACSSPVEDYIKNEFPRKVREDGITEEIRLEKARIYDSIVVLVAESNLAAKEAESAYAQYKAIKRDVETRVSKFNRTGNYSYIVAIAQDADKGEALYAKSQKLKKQAKPYTDHSSKQLKKLFQSLSSIDGESLMSYEDFVKTDSVTVGSIFSNVIGVPGCFANPSDEEIYNMAVAALKNYMVDNPTPTVKAYEHREDDSWYILLSNDTHFLLHAVKCADGQYSYQYKKVDNYVFSNNEQ